MRSLGSLSQVGVRALRVHRGRAALTIAGATLGVALLTGVAATNDSTAVSLDAAFGGDRRQTIDVIRLASSLPADIATRAAAIEGVAGATLAASAPVRAPQLSVGGSDAADLRVTSGTYVGGPAAPPSSVTGARSLAAGGTQGRRPQDGAHEVSIGAALAARGHIRVGDRLTLQGAAGAQTLDVVGIYGPNANGGIFVRQAVLSELAGSAVDQYASITLGPRVEPTAWLAAHGADLGTGVSLRSSAAQARRVREAIKPVQDSFSAVAGVALFVGAFLVYLTMSTAVQERTRTHGVLRAIGARRSQIVRLVLAEAAAVGVVATALGLVLGFVLARSLVRFTTSAYGLRSEGVAVTVPTVVTATIVGVVSSVVAAAIPAFRAARADPAAVMTTSGQAPSTGPRRRRFGAVAGTAMIAGGVAIAAGGGHRAPDPAPFLVLIGAIALVPPLLSPTARLVGHATRRLVRGVGDAAVMHLVRDRSTSAATAALVMTVLTMVVAITTTFWSYRSAIDAVIDRAGGPQIVAFSNPSFSPAQLATVRAVDGVGDITALRTGNAEILGSGTHWYFAIDPADFFVPSGLSWAKGSGPAAAQALRDDRSVVVPLSSAARLHAVIGGDLVIVTPNGPVHRRIAGIYEDLAGPALMFSAADIEALFGPGASDAVVIRTRPGAAVDPTAQALRTALGNPTGLSLRTASEDQARARSQVRKSFNAFFAVIGVAAIVGVLGLASTLATAVLRRTREIAVLRAIGTHRHEIARMLAVESLTITGVAALVATPVGVLMTGALLHGTSTDLGYSLSLHVPWTLAPLMILTTGVIGGLATIGPAWAASRLEPTDALRRE